eukprot:1477492-Pyramimonas_sp.AAC.1
MGGRFRGRLRRRMAFSAGYVQTGIGMVANVRFLREAFVFEVGVVLLPARQRGAESHCYAK